MDLETLEHRFNHTKPPLGSLASDAALPFMAYGKACLNCVKSKSRCASSVSQDSCERCHRLNKDCQPAPALRKRRVFKKPVPSKLSKTAVLEEKLDGIVQMLQRTQASMLEIHQPLDQIQNQRYSDEPFTALSTTSNDSSYVVRESPLDGNSQGRMSFGDSNIANGSKGVQEGIHNRLADGPPTPAPSMTGISAVTDRFYPATEYSLESKAELDDCLESYRSKMMPYFPIVCIGPDMTTEQLSKERPFLHLVLRAICSKNLDRRAALLLQVKEVLGREMLFEGTKNLDLLLGVLVFASWSHVHIGNGHKPIISTIIQLAISLAYDLGLLRPIPVEPVHVMLHFSVSGCPKPFNNPNSVRTVEERRAAVGLFLITSVSANFFQRIELMTWTPYLDECLRLLEENKDFPTDDLLVALVRVQIICNRAAASSGNNIFGDAGSKAPVDFSANTMKLQLDDLQRSIPLNIKHNVTLQLHILNTTLSIYEYNLRIFPQQTPSNHMVQLQQIESLWICLNSVKVWFNTFLSLEHFPLSSYSYISVSIVSQMAHCFVALYRLNTFQTPGIRWDRRRVREELDFGDIIKLIADRWEQSHPSICIESRPVSGSDHCSPTQNRLLGIGHWWDAQVAAMTAADLAGPSVSMGTEVSDGAAAVNSGFGASMGQTRLEGINMDMWDDTWIKDLFAGGNEFNWDSNF